MTIIQRSISSRKLRNNLLTYRAFPPLGHSQLIKLFRYLRQKAWL